MGRDILKMKKMEKMDGAEEKRVGFTAILQ